MPATGEPRREIYETWNTIAPTWPRRRGCIEEVTAPVRDWMVCDLAPLAGDTVPELAAGAGDTGFEVAPIPGADGRLICKARTIALLEAAGFDEVPIEEVPGRFAVDDADEYLGFVADTAGPLAAALRGVPDEETTAIRPGWRRRARRSRPAAATRCPSSPSPRWRAERPADHRHDHRRRRKHHGDEVASGEGTVGARGVAPAHGR